MEISVDISLYPLQEGYEKPILAFISALEKEQSIDVVRNELSTQLQCQHGRLLQLRLV